MGYVEREPCRARHAGQADRARQGTAPPAWWRCRSCRTGTGAAGDIPCGDGASRRSPSLRARRKDLDESTRAGGETRKRATVSERCFFRLGRQSFQIGLEVCLFDSNELASFKRVDACLDLDTQDLPAAAPTSWLRAKRNDVIWGHHGQRLHQRRQRQQHRLRRPGR